MLKVGIIGASGYTGLELIKLLLKHPEVKLSILTSERFSGKKVTDLFPALSTVIDKKFEKVSAKKITKKCDFVFTALPHKTAMPIVKKIFNEGIKIVDLSADFRLKEKQTYETWYSTTHTSPRLLKKSVYGLSEINRESIKCAKLVANPGCYPTSVILAIAPILKHDIIEPATITINSLSGLSGAGKTLKEDLLFSEANENAKAYSIACHRHTPEIEQELSLLSNSKITVSFTPHIVPLTRGMLSTINCKLKSKITTKKISKIYKEFYKNDIFIRILEDNFTIQTKNVSRTNFCDISVKVDERTNSLIITSAIDNLIKGASGQAVQNMNIMCGFLEKSALI